MAAPIVAAHPRWVVAQGTHCGLPYVVLSLPLGFLAGLVGVPSSSDLYGRSLHALATQSDLCPHGGFSYSSADLPELDQRESIWWLGWDYAQSSDRTNRDLPAAQSDLVAQELFTFLHCLVHGEPASAGTIWGVEKVREQVQAFCERMARPSHARDYGWPFPLGTE